MTLRDDLIGVVDDVRDNVVDAQVGLRLYTVSTVLRTWSGGVVGKGYSTDVVTELSPKPRVRPPSIRREMAEPGKFEAGDLVVDKVSASYEESDLTGGVLAAGTEFWWAIDGAPYRVVGKPIKRYLEWSLQLRRMRDRSAANPPPEE